MTTASRRAEKILEIVERTGIDEKLIESLVHTFYGKVRKDALLGPVFSDRIDDWEPHLQRMCAFWSSVALMSGRYHGQPMEKHVPLPIDARHFDRWLELFEETALALCTPIAANHFISRARQIAESLELGIASQNAYFLAKGERLERPESEVFLPNSTNTMGAPA